MLDAVCVYFSERLRDKPMEVSFVILETHSRVVWLIPKMEVTGMTGFVFRPYTAVLAADIRWRCSQPLRCIGVLLVGSGWLLEIIMFSGFRGGGYGIKSLTMEYGMKIIPAMWM